MLVKTKAMSLSSFSLLLLALYATVLPIAADSDARRLDHLERRIKSLEKLVDTQNVAIEGLLRRGLETSDDGCLPKRNEQNVCVFEKGVEFSYRNSDLVFESSTVRFTGPIQDLNAIGKTGMTNQTTYAFSSQVIFDSTDVRVENSNVTFTAEHDYKAFQKNETQLRQHYGFIVMNNTEMALNSSRLVVTGPDPRSVNQSLYDDLSYSNLFSSIGFSYSNITVTDSNVAFTKNTPSETADSTIVFNHSKILYNHSEVKMHASKTSASDSSISYGKDTYVQWFGSSSAAYFTDGAELSVEDSNVRLDQTTLELTGNNGKLVSRVDTDIRGPDSGDPIYFTVSRKVDVSYEQYPTMRIQSDVKVSDDSDVTFDSSSTLKINGKLESNDDTRFRGQISLDDVLVNVERDLMIDGRNGYENANIDFRNGVDIRIYNDLVVEKDLEVLGHANLDSLDVLDEATVGGRLRCYKGATISGDSNASSDSITSSFSSQLLKVEGSALIQRDLEVDGTLTAESQDFVGDVVISGNARVNSLTVDSTATVSGTTTVGTIKATSSGYINGQLTAGTIKAENDIFFQNLDISGKATVNTLDVSGDASVGGKLSAVKSTSYFQEIAVTKNAVVGGFIESTNSTVRKFSVVSGNATVVGNLEVGGTFKPQNSQFENIVVTGVADVGSLKTSGSASIGGTATVQSLTVDSNVDVGGNLNIGGTLSDVAFYNLSILGTASIGTLSVSSSASIGGTTTLETLSVGADVDVIGTLSVSGKFAPEDTEFNDISVLGTATVTSLSAESALISNAATIQTLTVGADADVAGSLSVGGTFTPSESEFQDITISGTATVGTLSATSASISDSASINRLTVGSDADISGALSIGGIFASNTIECTDITATGFASINSLQVNNASIEDATAANLNVGLNAEISGDLTVLGTIINSA